MKFPTILDISNVLPYIEGHEEFSIVERDGYTVINYQIIKEDTFPDILREVGKDIYARPMLEWDEEALVRRECRGIIFDNVTGAILRRPYHKFFNYKERKETQRIDMSRPHTVLEKLDGSMIAPFYLGKELKWGTKAGETDVSNQVLPHINSFYTDFVNNCIKLHNSTPIFEWCSNKQRIVLNNEKDQLVLTAIRHMHTGAYWSYNDMTTFATPYQIPVVQWLETNANDEELSEWTSQLEDTEGFVVAFDDGYRVKMKTHWYVQLHRVKEAIQQDRNIVELIIEDHIDDIKAQMLPQDIDRLNDFHNQFINKITSLAQNVSNFVSKAHEENISRKDFSLEWVNDLDPLTKALCFRIWYNPSPQTALVEIKNTIRNNLNKNSKYFELRNIWFTGVIYNAE